jgi:hypothetical protein
MIREQENFCCIAGSMITVSALIDLGCTCAKQRNVSARPRNPQGLKDAEKTFGWQGPDMPKQFVWRYACQRKHVSAAAANG